MSKVDALNVSRTPSDWPWRADLLTQMSLKRLKGFSIHHAEKSDLFNYLLVSDDGFTLMVNVREFSSFKKQVTDVENISILSFSVPTAWLVQAVKLPSPLLVFLFDSDSDHGRFLHLTNDCIVNEGHAYQELNFPKQNTISAVSLANQVNALQGERLSA